MDSEPMGAPSGKNGRTMSWYPDFLNSTNKLFLKEEILCLMLMKFMKD